MRPAKRIKLFLNIVLDQWIQWSKLEDKSKFKSLIDNMEKQWKEQSADLRFFQYLTNSGIEDTIEGWDFLDFILSFNQGTPDGILYHYEEDEIIELFFPSIKPREYLSWKSYGKNGDEPPTVKLVKDLDTDHIKAILREKFDLSELYQKTLEEELELRQCKNN